MTETQITVDHTGKSPLEMLAFVNGALKGIIAFIDLPEPGQQVMKELQWAVDTYVDSVQPGLSSDD